MLRKVYNLKHDSLYNNMQEFAFKQMMKFQRGKIDIKLHDKCREFYSYYVIFYIKNHSGGFVQNVYINNMTATGHYPDTAPLSEGETKT